MNRFGGLLLRFKLFELILKVNDHISPIELKIRSIKIFLLTNFKYNLLVLHQNAIYQQILIDLYICIGLIGDFGVENKNTFDIMRYKMTYF